jgi:hypothetical protein
MRKEERHPHGEVQHPGDVPLPTRPRGVVSVGFGNLAKGDASQQQLQVKEAPESKGKL